MQCPKCGNKQNDTIECKSCGLIFAKYKGYLEAKKQENESVTYQYQQSNNKLPWLIASVVIVIALTFFILRGEETNIPTKLTSVVTAPEKSSPDSDQSDINDYNGGINLVAQLSESSPAHNAIEEARNATVLVQTSWGSGTGFFFTSDCKIITNRHVIKFSEEKIAAVQKLIDDRTDQLERHKKKMKRYKQEYFKRCQGCKHSDFVRSMTEIKEEYNAAEDELRTVKKELFNLKYLNELKVILTDSTEMEATLLYESDNFDLALLQLRDKAHCPAIKPASSNNLTFGETLYTIGNPVGLRHVVTSGVYSGRIKLNGTEMIQTDAPINPGNSGGPLINEKGEVHGINTLIIKNTEGIGFAIPIETAINEFDL